jgi:hypothetical protein
MMSMRGRTWVFEMSGSSCICCTRRAHMQTRACTPCMCDCRPRAGPGAQHGRADDDHVQPRNDAARAVRVPQRPHPGEPCVPRGAVRQQPHPRAAGSGHEPQPVRPCSCARCAVRSLCRPEPAARAAAAVLLPSVHCPLSWVGAANVQGGRLRSPCACAGLPSALSRGAPQRSFAHLLCSGTCCV